MLLWFLKAMVHRYREGTPAEFWATFSTEDGEHLSWKAINSQLAVERIERDRKLAIRAQREYADSFATIFRYRKGSQYHVMTKPSTIARKYRQLQEEVM